jgi:hypothetical protein
MICILLMMTEYLLLMKDYPSIIGTMGAGGMCSEAAVKIIDKLYFL